MYFFWAGSGIRVVLYLECTVGLSRVAVQYLPKGGIRQGVCTFCAVLTVRGGIKRELYILRSGEIRAGGLYGQGGCTYCTYRVGIRQKGCN
jgi:hypothetical protein